MNTERNLEGRIQEIEKYVNKICHEINALT